MPRTPSAVRAALASALLVASGTLAGRSEAQELAGVVDTVATVAVTTTPTAAGDSAARPARSLLLDSARGRVAASPAPLSDATGHETLAQPERRLGAGRNVALMAVGATGLVTGLVIGGNGGAILAVGSAVVGLVGLYRFLR